MPRLVDADAVKRMLCGDCYNTLCDGECDVTDALNALPTINSEKRGEWKDKVIYSNVMEPTGAYYHKCSECGFTIGNSDKRLWWNYCPKCGVRMDGEGNE